MPQRGKQGLWEHNAWEILLVQIPLVLDTFGPQIPLVLDTFGLRYLWFRYLWFRYLQAESACQQPQPPMGGRGSCQRCDSCMFVVVLL